MKNQISTEVRQIAIEKAKTMPLGTFSRLKINGQVSDIVISPSSSGLYFYNEPSVIGKDILEKQIAYIPNN